MANSHVQGLSLRTQVHVMTLMRTTAGINKVEHAGRAGRMDAQIGLADALRRSRCRCWPAISNFVAGFARRLCATEVQ